MTSPPMSELVDSPFSEGELRSQMGRSDHTEGLTHALAQVLLPASHVRCPLSILPSKKTWTEPQAAQR